MEAQLLPELATELGICHPRDAALQAGRSLRLMEVSKECLGGQVVLLIHSVITWAGSVLSSARNRELTSSVLGKRFTS